MDCELFFEVVWRHVFRCDKSQYAGVFALTNPPDMQVADGGKDWALGDDLADFLDDRCVHLGVEKHLSRVPHQVERPSSYQDCTDQAHHWVEPARAPELSSEEGNDGQN